MNNTRVTFVHFTGTETIFTNNWGGGCEGFFKSSNIVKLGTINMVIMYTTTIPNARDHPTVWIGAMGVNVREMNPMIVVTADKKTALPVEFNASSIFSLGVPFASA